jgi:transposase-like protein
MPSRKKYSQEYKQEAVQLVQAGNVAVGQVAQELGINANMLGRWCRELKGTSG